jgi:hypothetical protein
MPHLQADFTKISSSFDPLPPEAYVCIVDEITEKASAEANLPMLVFELVVDDPSKPDYAERRLFDNIVLKTKKGAVNKVGLGQVKAYAEAILGVEAANNPEGINTDDLKHGSVLVVVTQRSYTQDGEVKVSNDIKKVLPVP